jgi:hypothetical protein
VGNSHSSETHGFLQYHHKAPLEFDRRSSIPITVPPSLLVHANSREGRSFDETTDHGYPTSLASPVVSILALNLMSLDCIPNGWFGLRSSGAR